LPVKGDDREVSRVSYQLLPPLSHVSEGAGLAPTAVAERVSDDDEEDAMEKLGSFHRQRAKTSRGDPARDDGYCQCHDRAVPTSTGGDVVDRRPPNLPRDFRAIQRSATASKMVPRPLRSASVDRHEDGWSGTSSVKCQPINGAPLLCSRNNRSNAYRVATPTDLAVHGGQTRSSRRHRTSPPPWGGVVREISQATNTVVTTKQLTGGTVDSLDVVSDVSDLDRDIVDDLHLAESVTGFTRRACRSSDTLTPTASSTDSTDSQPRQQNGWIQTDSAPVVLRRSSAQEQIRSGTPRTQRAGSYHGLIHHSTTFSDFPSLTSSNLRMGVAKGSPVGSLKNALVNLAGRWSKSGRKCSASRNDVREVEDGQTGCVADHGAGFVSRIVARASCRLAKNRSKSGERVLGPRSVTVCGGRVTVSAVSLRHSHMMSSGETTSTIYAADDPVSGPGDELLYTDEHHVPWIDDSESEYG